VRKQCGLFDICHMGEIEIVGKGAKDLVQWLTSNDVNRLKDGQAQYSLLMQEKGYAMDDIIVYRLGPERWMLCVNAANAGRDLKHILKHQRSDVEIVDQSEATALLALQGPASAEVLKKLGVELGSVPRFHTLDITIAHVPVLFSRTGYTGEAGCELFFSATEAEKLWSLILETGVAAGCQPIGLAARDTLRLEMGYVLYGHELSEQIHPLEAGLEWVVAWDAGDFLGREALAGFKESGVQRRVTGLKLLDKGIPREGMEVFQGDRPIGRILSGTMSPTLQQGIATALLDVAAMQDDGEVFVDIRGKMKKAARTKPPFI
jgi:aminomethyltransferase